MAYLLVLKGGNAEKSIALDKDRIVLGRNATCDIVFPANDFAVSREHASILRVNGKFFVEDLGSRNGTFVNNQQITARTPLTDNDRVRICDFLYSFHDDAQTFRPPLPADLKPELTIAETEEFAGFEAAVSGSSPLVLDQPSDKLRALIDISNNLSRTLELDPLLPKIVDSLFQLFKQADRGFIILKEEVTEKDKLVEKLIPKVIKTRRGPDEATASYSRSIVRECLKTVQAFLSDDASQDKRFNMSQSIADFRIRSVMCAPLWNQEENKAFGVIQLDTQDRTKKFTQEDLNLLMAVANQASTALENARLHEDLMARERMRRDMELAHQVQLSFLPQQVPQVPAYQFFSHYEPAHAVGGDYYGFIPMSAPATGWAILLGDVAGKGVPAALLMAKLSSDARFSLLREADGGKAISILNELLYPNTSQMDRFVTLAAAILNPVTHRVVFANAGHPTPLIFRGATRKFEDATGRDVISLPLGVVEGIEYGSRELTLEPGDTVFMFSDGVTEAMDKNNNQLQFQAFHAAVKDGDLSPKAVGERVVRLVRQHAAGRSQHDDITLVCFGRIE